MTAQRQEAYDAAMTALAALRERLTYTAGVLDEVHILARSLDPARGGEVPHFMALRSRLNELGNLHTIGQQQFTAVRDQLAQLIGDCDGFG